MENVKGQDIWVMRNFQGETRVICDKLSKVIKPIFGSNFRNYLTYDTVFTSNTHHLVENEFRTVDYLSDSFNNFPQRPRVNRYELQRTRPREEQQHIVDWKKKNFRVKLRPKTPVTFSVPVMMSRDKDFYKMYNIITRQIHKERENELKEAAEGRSESPTQGNYLTRSVQEKLMKARAQSTAEPSYRTAFTDKMVKTDCSADFYDCKIDTLLP